MAQVSGPSSVRAGLRVGVAVIAMGLTLAGCASQTPSTRTPTPDPAAAQLVEDYLDAIASGDAEAAHALDAHLFTGPSYADRDVTSLLTDDVLTSSDRIQDVVVREQDWPANPDAKVGIGYEYSLDGEPFSGTLHVRRDDETSDWMLTAPLVGVLLVQAEAADGSKKPIDFSVPGAEYTADPAAEKPQLVSAYPAVYSVTAGVPQTDLAPGTGLTQRAVLGEVDGVYVNFAVTALP